MTSIAIILNLVIGTGAATALTVLVRVARGFLATVFDGLADLRRADAAVLHAKADCIRALRCDPMNPAFNPRPSPRSSYKGTVA